MRILILTSPGRFPTVVHDPGLWWSAIANDRKHVLQSYSANYSWWNTICSSYFKQLILEPIRGLDRLQQRARWYVDKLALDGAAASRSLAQLTAREPFDSAVSYVNTLAPIADYLIDINRAQSEFNVSISNGPRVASLNYDDSAELVSYSRQSSLLYRTIRASLGGCPADLDVVLLSVTSSEDLLTTLIIARVLGERNCDAHLSLIDHGYENFSLHAKLEQLRRAGAFDEAFDTMIVAKDDRDEVIPNLIDAIALGHRPRGLLYRTSFHPNLSKQSLGYVPPPAVPTFSPEPIFWTRLSQRRCYWSRCTYCTQNSKYENPRAPTRTEIMQSLDRIEACIAAGYRFFYFSDEALSPSTLTMLANEIQSRHLNLRWACRCKLERAHTPALIRALAKSGCYEILFGLETTSPRVLKMMDKYVEGLDEPYIQAIFKAMSEEGIGIHANLIGGYPGDTLTETERSVEFLISTFSQLQGCTYALNGFQLLADTPIANTPEQFGIAKVLSAGDVAQSYEFELRFEIDRTTKEVLSAIPSLQEKLDSALGWTNISSDPGAQMALKLYFGSGHGSIFKARASENPFANPLQHFSPTTTQILKKDQGFLLTSRVNQ